MAIICGWPLLSIDVLALLGPVHFGQRPAVAIVQRILFIHRHLAIARQGLSMLIGVICRHRRKVSGGHHIVDIRRQGDVPRLR